VRRGILGGTFNPIHIGHLQIAIGAMQTANLDEILWVPTYQPTYRSLCTLVPFAHRMAMVAMAIAPYPAFKVSSIEQQQPGQSYALHTFQTLQAEYPHSRWFWIIGLDAFQTLPRWYGRRSLAPACEWLVAPRVSSHGMGASQTCSELTLWDVVKQAEDECRQVDAKLAMEAIPIRWQVLPVQPQPISGAQIRQARSDRQSIQPFVPPAVATYIAIHDLYYHS
jgi:nicotinate-nucleotide adenylyltransferase